MQRCTLKAFSEFSENRGHARVQVTPLERICRQRFSLERRITRSSVLQNSQKCWIGKNQARLGARHPLEHETQCPARASIIPLERTSKQNKNAGSTISTLERQSPCSSVSPNFGNSRFEPQAQNQVLNHKFRSSWANFPVNTSKLILQHDSKLNQ